MTWIIFILGMGILARLAGTGFGSKWNVPWLPELIFAIPFGTAFAWAINLTGTHFGWVLLALVAGVSTSYGFMQSATWSFLRWDNGDKNPNLTRSFTLKSLVDLIARQLNYKLGDEGYSWVSASVKGFMIGLPIGGVFTAILWPIGYEIGSHARGRVDKWFNPHAVAEVAAGIGGGISIYLFVQLVKLLGG